MDFELSNLPTFKQTLNHRTDALPVEDEAEDDGETEWEDADGDDVGDDSNNEEEDDDDEEEDEEDDDDDDNDDDDDDESGDPDAAKGVSREELAVLYGGPLIPSWQQLCLPPELGRNPMSEDHFGTLFWDDPIPKDMLDYWGSSVAVDRIAGGSSWEENRSSLGDTNSQSCFSSSWLLTPKDEDGNDVVLRLPGKNPFIPTDLALVDIYETESALHTSPSPPPPPPPPKLTSSSPAALARPPAAASQISPAKVVYKGSQGRNQETITGNQETITGNQVTITGNQEDVVVLWHSADLVYRTPKVELFCRVASEYCRYKFEFVGNPVQYPLYPLLSSPLLSSPLLSSPLISSPLLFSPLLSSPLHSSPLLSSPLLSSPLHSSPLHSSPLLSTPLLSSPLISLS